MNNPHWLDVEDRRRIFQGHKVAGLTNIRLTTASPVDQSDASENEANPFSLNYRKMNW